MAVTIELNPGVTTTIAQTTAVALPPRTCQVIATTALQFSADGSTWTADVTATTTGTTTQGGFARCTSSTSIVRLTLL